MGMAITGAIICWSVLVVCNWWPPFLFPVRESFSAFLLQGFPLDISGFTGAMLAHGRNILFAALILLSVRGWGSVVAGIIRFPRRIPFLRFCFGLSVFSGAVLGAGLTGLLQAPVLWAGLLVGLVMGRDFVRIRLFPDSFPRPVLGLIALTFLPAFFAALAPEATYDALAYHLGAPEQWLKIGRIVRLEHMFFSDFPLVLQSVYLAAMGVGGGTGAAKIIHFLLGIFCVGSVARLGERAGGRTAGIWAAVFMAGTGLVTTQMGKANVDLGVVLATVTGLMVLLESRTNMGALCAGLCFGAAAGIKLTGGIGAVAGLLVLFRREGAAGMKAVRFDPVSGMLFSGGVIIVLFPWFARTWLGSGNPFYPFLFGGLGWSIQNSSAYRFDMTGPTSFNLQYPGFLSRLAGPWSTFMHDRGSEAALGAFTLVLAPFAFLIRRSISPSARIISLFALIFWIIWFMVARDPRFFLPALPACAVLSAVALSSVTGVFGRVLCLAFAVWAAFAPLYASRVVYRTLNPGPVVWGAMERSIYENALIPAPNFFVPMARATAGLPAGKRILVVGDVKAVKILPRALYQSMFDTPHIEESVRRVRSSGDLNRWFRQNNIGTVFFNPGGAVYLRSQFGHYQWTPRERAVLAGFWATRLYPIRETRNDGDLVMGLYEVGLRPGARVILPIPGESR